MTRVALYAWYSSEGQREASIEDQYRNWARRNGSAPWCKTWTKSKGIFSEKMPSRSGSSPDRIPCRLSLGFMWARSRAAREHTGEEVAYRASDFCAMCFEGKMPGVEEDDLGARVVPREGVGPGWEKERIGFAPHGERRWPVGPEIRLELGIQLDVARVVQKQIQLDLLIPGTRQQRGVERIGLRRHARLLRPVRVLPLGGLRREKGLQRRPVFRRGVSPILLNRVPARAESVLVGIPVLRHNRGDPFRMPKGQPETHRGAIVEDIEGVAGEAQPVRKLLDHVRQPIKGVREARRARRIREAKAREVGRDHVVVGCQQGDQVAEHVRRGGKPMQEQDGWGCCRACFAIEDLQSVHVLRAVVSNAVLLSHDTPLVKILP